MKDIKNEEQYPSLSLAHQFVLPSYSWMLNRLASVENRVQSLLILISTVTMGIPLVVVGLSGEVHHLNGWLAIWAFLLFALSTILGLVARAWGTIELVDPANFSDEWISQSPEEFRKWSTHYAGKHYAKNNALIFRKSLVVDIAVGVFVIEVFLWAWWASNVLSI